MKLPASARNRVLDDFGRGRLPDHRLQERLLSVVEALAANPAAGLPAALQDAASLEGAYRLLNNPRVTLDGIHEEHAAKTLQRARAAEDVLVIHDTTACAFRHANAEQIGFLSTGKPGFYVHVSLVTSMEAGAPRPLGVAHLEVVSRAKKTRGRDRHIQATTTAKDEGREFLRWNRGVAATAELLHDVDNVVHVMDSEGDSFALFAPMVAAKQRFVVRACHNRKARASSEEKWLKLDELSKRGDVILERTVTLSQRKKTRRRVEGSRRLPREERNAKLSVSATQVTLRGPHYANTVKQIVINVVRVFEAKPPKGEEPVEWILLTTEPIKTRRDIERIVDVYRRRWLIEEFFKALKSGCKYTKRQFEKLGALKNLLAIYLPIAVEILWLRARARATPNARATQVFTGTQLDVLRAMGRRSLPKQPTIAEAVWALAGLAGHRDSNGEPGWQILATAYQKLVDYEAGWIARGAM